LAYGHVGTDPIPIILCNQALIKIRLIHNAHIYANHVVEGWHEGLAYWGMEVYRIASSWMSWVPVLIHDFSCTNGSQ
jgi:hypothetical protein